MKGIEYLDCVVKATTLDINDGMEDRPANQMVKSNENMSSLENIQRKIEKWKELTADLGTLFLQIRYQFQISNLSYFCDLDWIKEQMFGETSSTNVNHWKITQTNLENPAT